MKHYLILKSPLSSATLTTNVFSSIVVPIYTGFACGLTSTKIVLCQINLNKHNEFEKRYERAQKTLTPLNNSKKMFEDNALDKAKLTLYVRRFQIK